MKVYLLVGVLFFNLSVFGQDSEGTKINNNKDKKSTYVSFSAGYGFGIGIGSNRQIQQSPYSSKVSYNLHSYGKGFNISAALGMMFSKNIGGEVNLGYHFGGPNRVNNIWSFDTSTVQRIDENATFRANYLIVNPNLVISASSSKIVEPYVKLGPSVVFAKAKSSYENKFRFTDGIRGTQLIEWEWTGGFGIGFSTSAGIKIKTPTERVVFVMEVAYNSLSFDFKKGKMVDISYYNMYSNQIRTVSDNEVIMVSEVDEKAVQNPNKPSQVLNYKSNADNISFNLGWYIKL
ncbi:hypothetical protein SGRA_2063 [Sporocytophaga myxococcoides]|uniref:Outer membrane protein beta-barrel domain-containing protein n=1 Tax=Sporocytophaga myxococcoides TaxID=153721 RepID=A0A098LI77_9BACT|nr:outer membrane beta-barrel protein [Sporocytophaga myxococcoides]GAL86179.1 hypothetical protein SGRA_2063 [Sporocytophaga myxococcoides]